MGCIYVLIGTLYKRCQQFYTEWYEMLLKSAKRGRPSSVDPENAMAAIVESFRRKGYAATSLDDLTAATGLSRPSLYRAFGDKMAMYLAAMDAFSADAVHQAVPALEKAATAEAALADFYNAMLDIYYRDESVAPGCLVFATAPCGSAEEAIRTRLKLGVDGLDGLFRRAFRRYAPDEPEETLRTAVELAANTLLALSTRAKSGASKADLSAMGARTAATVGILLRTAPPAGA